MLNLLEEYEVFLCINNLQRDFESEDALLISNYGQPTLTPEGQTDNPYNKKKFGTT